MIFIPCIIHTIYWLDKAGEPLKSILLFEMPVVFYISGATIYITDKRKSVWETAKNRFKRIMVPYYWYAAACLALIIAMMICGQPSRHIGLVSFIKLITAQDCSLPIPYMYHLWFIIPYFITACLFPVNRMICDRFNRWKYLSSYFLLLLLSEPLWEIHTSYILNIVRQAVYYNFFFMAGYLTYKRTSRRQTILISGIAAAALTALTALTYHSGGSLSMQSHKFPPDALFISYGILAICVLSLLLRNIVIPYNRVLHYWNKHGYTLYLWQNFSFWILTFLYLFVEPFELLKQYPILDFIASAILIFAIEYAISFTLIKTSEILRGCRLRGCLKPTS